MKHECQALSRDITPDECAIARKELPEKFCEGCDCRPEPIKRIPSKYVVYVSKELKNRIGDECKRLGIEPRGLIAKILAEKLFPEKGS